ncbi:hypothetical protein D3C71_1505860 [compost metagenome]
MIAGALGRRKTQQFLGTAQLIEKCLGAAGQGVVLGLRHERRASDLFDAAGHRELLDRTQVIAQIADAMDPEATLDDFPFECRVRQQELRQPVQHRLLEFSQLGRALGRSAELERQGTDQPGKAPLPRVGDTGGKPMLA